MRKEMSATLEREAKADHKMIFITGDLGFMALENVRNIMKERFINAGVSEQNMISLAAGMASQGLKPICYSIAPFAVFRPAEQIRLDVCLHNMDVKIIGNGGGYGYGIMGATHHAIEDLAVLSAFQNMKCFIPFCNEDVDTVLCRMLDRVGPSYLRLGYGSLPKNISIPGYSAVRHIVHGKKITVVMMGPVALNVLNILDQLDEHTIDMFVVSELPMIELDPSLHESISKTQKVVIVEEHVSRGGLGENLSLLLLKKGVNCKLIHHCATGYPSGLYGSQAYHQKTCGLDSNSILGSIKENF